MGFAALVHESIAIGVITLRQTRYIHVCDSAQNEPFGVK